MWCSAPGISFGEHFFGDMKRRIRRGHAAVNRTLQNDFLNLFTRHLIAQRRAHMHFEFLRAIEGNGHLEEVSWRDAKTNVSELHAIHHLFLMTGAAPNTGWLDGCVVLDEKKFVKTGPDLTAEDLAAAQWPMKRPPYLLETSVPRVFAVGDVRSGSVKRVASAVGEGSIAVQLLHHVLAE